MNEGKHMNGQHRIVIQNKRIRYDFTLHRNLTILRGDSATGKTALIDMVREYTNHGAASSIELFCDKACQVLEGSTWQGQLSMIKDSIVFIDEGNAFVLTDAFACAIQQTDNYYVIVTRESLPNLPYSIQEIYGIRNAGKYGGLKQIYNAFYRIYGSVSSVDDSLTRILIVEDSHAGFQFYAGIHRDGISCISAGGKSHILQQVKQTGEEQILVIADGAAFGPEMDRMMAYVRNHDNVRLFLPESFEWLILDSGLIKAAELKMILEEPADYIESAEFFSWERYFTHLLTELTLGSYLQYSKREINPAYLNPKAAAMILAKYEELKILMPNSQSEKSEN